MATGIIPKFTDGNDSGWLSHTGTAPAGTDPGDTYSGTIYWRQIGEIATVIGYNLKLRESITTNNPRTLLTALVPKPKESVTLFCGNTGQQGMIRINTLGSLFFYKLITDTSWTTTANINFQSIYFVK